MILRDIDLASFDGIVLPSISNNFVDVAAFTAYGVDITNAIDSACGYFYDMYVNGTTASLTDECTGATYAKSNIVLLVKDDYIMNMIKTMKSSQNAIVHTKDYTFIVNGYTTYTMCGQLYSVIKGMALTYDPTPSGYNKVSSTSISSNTFQLSLFEKDKAFLHHERVLRVQVDVDSATYGQFDTPYSSMATTSMYLPESKSVLPEFPVMVARGHKSGFLAISNEQLFNEMCGATGQFSIVAGALESAPVVALYPCYKFVYSIKRMGSSLGKRANIYTFNFSGVVI